MAALPIITDVTNLSAQGALNPANPPTNSLLNSSDMRANFQELANGRQDFRHRCFANNAVGKRVTATRADRGTTFTCWYDGVKYPVLSTFGVPFISQWIQPSKVGNKMWIEATLFGEFDENIAFYVTVSNNASWGATATGADISYTTNQPWMDSLQWVHPVFMRTPTLSVSREEGLCTAGAFIANGTAGQTIHFAVEDTITVVGIGHCYTVWARATAGYGGRIPATDPLHRQEFTLNQTRGTDGVAVEYGISTLSVTETWYQPNGEA